MTNHDRFGELIPIYATGALEGEEMKEIEEHLKTGCPLCQERLREMEEVLHLLSYSTPPVSPSSRVKERLFERIKTAKEPSKESHPPTFWQRLNPVWFGLGWAVALALLVFLFISNLSLRDRLGERQLEVSNLREQINRQSENIEFLMNKVVEGQVGINDLKEQIVGQNEIIGFLRNPNVVVINLVGLEPSLQARGRVLWNTKSNKALFYGLNLPRTPSGKTYQLWVIADNAPKSAGIFDVNERGDGVIKLKSLPDPSKVQKFAVTLEPEGGLPQPTGDMYLAGDT